MSAFAYWPPTLAGIASLRGSGRRLKIWFLGDSHTEGKIPTLTVAGSEQLGSELVASPLDRQWTGSAWADHCRLDCNIAIVNTTSTDPNIGIATGQGSYAALVPQHLRAGIASDLIGVDIVVTGAGGSSTYSWAGEQAQGYLQIPAGLPQAGDTVTVGATTYTFRASASAANEVTIGADAPSTLNNLENAINAEGTGWGAGTTQNASVFCPNTTTNTLSRLIAVTPGTAGNSLALSTTGARITVLQGFAGGQASSNLYAENKAQVAAGFGSPDIVVVGLGTNDAVRPGWRGRGAQAALSSLVAKIHTDYPAARVILWRAPTAADATSNTAVTNTILPAIDAVVSANSFCSSVDIHALGASLTGHCGIVGSDGVHWTRYGYYLMPQMVAAKVASVASAAGLV